MNKQNGNRKLSAEKFFNQQRIHADNTLPGSEFSEKLAEKLQSLHLNINGEKPQNPMNVKNIFKGRLFNLIGYPAVATLGIITFILLAIPFVKSTNLGPRNSVISAELTYLEGMVEYKTLNKDWIAAQDGMILTEGTSIRVTGEGKAIVSIDDGSAVRLDDNSSITLASMDPKNIVISNDSGSIYSRVVEADRSFTVKAADVSYKSLGTSYKTVNMENRKGVEVYQSKVEIEAIKLNEGITVEEGQKFYFENENPEFQEKITELTVEEIVADAFALWNKQQDEKVEEYKTKLGKLGDLTGPGLTIDTPADGVTTKGKTIGVTGTVEAGARVFINGNEVENVNGIYSAEIVLGMGENKIEVKAVDAAGNKTYKSITVTRAEETPAVVKGISLYGQKVDGGIKLTWTVSGLDTSKGFKLSKSTSDKTPSYPENGGTFIEGSKRSYTVSVTDGKTYYFRICQYNGSGCSVYSNTATVKAPEVLGTSEGTASILLSHNGSTNVSWTVTNGTAEGGFKLVWSKSTNPAYGSSYAKYYGPGSTAGSISASEGAGKYYVRICRYTGSG